MLNPGRCASGTATMCGAICLCGLLVTGNVPAAERWYKPDYVAAGKALFDDNCAACHKAGGVGTENWRERDASGLLPAPPLNGTAHTWHHPLSVLYRQIMTGSAPGVGNMPPFKGRLSQAEALAIIAYVQSLWSDEVYAAWRQIDAASK